MVSGKPGLDDFPVRTSDKIRYADTDRQGHVNNAVFSTLLESGRVEILYDRKTPLAARGCAFVIANMNIDFHSELHWPGTAHVGTRTVSVGRSSIKLDQVIFQRDSCVATATTVIVQMNEATRKSHPLLQETVKFLSALKNPDSKTG